MRPLMQLGPALFCLWASACSSYQQHTELPLQHELRLTPAQNTTRVQFTVERYWSEDSAPRGGWQATDYLNGAATVHWINLGPDPAPSVVEIRGRGPVQIDTQASAVLPNRDQWVNTSTQFAFERCRSRCTFELELSWHHAQSGELRVTWNVQANRSAYSRNGIHSRNWQYRVVEIQGASVEPSEPVRVVEPNNN